MKPISRSSIDTLRALEGFIAYALNPVKMTIKIFLKKAEDAKPLPDEIDGYRVVTTVWPPVS